jgi:hypothetical protein
MLRVHRRNLFARHVKKGRVKSVDILGEEVRALGGEDSRLLRVIVAVGLLLEAGLGDGREGGFGLGEEVVEALTACAGSAVGDSDDGYGGLQVWLFGVHCAGGGWVVHVSADLGVEGKDGKD